MEIVEGIRLVATISYSPNGRWLCKIRREFSSFDVLCSRSFGVTAQMKDMHVCVIPQEPPAFSCKEIPGESVQMGSPLQLASLNKYTGRGNAWLSKILSSPNSGFKQNEI